MVVLENKEMETALKMLLVYGAFGEHRTLVNEIQNRNGGFISMGRGCSCGTISCTSFYMSDNFK